MLPLGGRGAAGQGTGVTDALLEDATIAKVAAALGKTPAQVMLRWALQRGVVPIPKASSEARLRENMGALCFELSREDMEKINQLDMGFQRLQAAVGRASCVAMALGQQWPAPGVKEPGEYTQLDELRRYAEAMRKRQPDELHVAAANCIQTCAAL